MISIIVPIYNQKKYLRQCIESILAQTYQDFELILVDDGSLDGSLTICNEYSKKDKRILVIHQENAGVSAARNNGIEHAHGEWISFIDSDDWVTSDYIDNFKLDEEDADLIIQGIEYYDHRTCLFFKQVKVKNCVIDEGDVKKIIAENNVLGSGYPVAKAFRKSILDSGVRFDTSISYHEDHIFVLNAMAITTKIRLVDSIAYKYRYFHTNLSLSSKRHSWQSLNIAANGMLVAIASLQNRFIESGSSYERMIYNFGYTPKISAVFEIFRSKCSDKAKNLALDAVIDKKQLNTYYHPISVKDKLVKYILSCPIFLIKKTFFILYINYQDRNKWK